MTKPKRRGTNFEYRTAYKFEEFGYTWDRSGSSLGVDLKILKNGDLRYLVSCKKTSESNTIYIPKAEIQEFSEESSLRGVKGLICYGFYRTPIFVHPLEKIDELDETKKNYKFQAGESQSLEEFLKEEENEDCSQRSRKQQNKASN